MIYYFEHYPHYMGTTNAEIGMTDEQFDKLTELAAASRNNELDDNYERMEEYAESIVGGVTVYALVDAFYNFGDAKRPKQIAKKLAKKGVCADMWEEGSYALSNKSMKAARKAVGKIEAKQVEGEFDY